MTQHNASTKKSMALICFLVLINILLFISIIISWKHFGKNGHASGGEDSQTGSSSVDNNQTSSTAASASSTTKPIDLNTTGDDPSTGASTVQNPPDDTPTAEVAEEPPANEIITFPDSALEKAIREELKIEGREITREDALQCKELNLSGAGKAAEDRISDLTGLSAFVNLTSLELRNNKISNTCVCSLLSCFVKVILYKPRCSFLCTVREVPFPSR